MRGPFLLLCSFALACDCGTRPGLSRGELRLSPPSLSFMTAPGAPVSAAVTLSNIGTANVTVTAITIADDTRGVFSVDMKPLVVGAGGSAELLVTYSPSAAGDDAAQLVIDADASNGMTFVVALLGASRAVVPDAGPPDAGPPDAGPPDAGPPDAGPPDAGPPDAGPPDAGPPDAGPPNVFGFPSGLGRRSSSGGTFSVEGEIGITTPRVVSKGGTFSVEPLIPGGN